MWRLTGNYTDKEGIRRAEVSDGRRGGLSDRAEVYQNVGKRAEACDGQYHTLRRGKIAVTFNAQLARAVVEDAGGARLANGLPQHGSCCSYGCCQNFLTEQPLYHKGTLSPTY